MNDGKQRHVTTQIQESNRDLQINLQEQRHKKWFLARFLKYFVGKNTFQVKQKDYREFR